MIQISKYVISYIYIPINKNPFTFSFPFEKYTYITFLLCSVSLSPFDKNFITPRISSMLTAGREPTHRDYKVSELRRSERGLGFHKILQTYLALALFTYCHINRLCYMTSMCGEHVRVTLDHNSPVW